MIKAGILGGGQLGRMLLQAAANYVVDTYVMENDEDCPAAHLCHHFIKGDIQNYDDVYAFGKNLDVITIEIESVNAEALEQLEKEGKKIYPSPEALKIIKNKILQKEFYKNQNIPTAEFVITKNKSELQAHQNFLPGVHKLGQGGYDGRGVVVLNNSEDLSKGFDDAAVLEKKINISKEIAIIIGVSNSGEMAIYPPVDMVFDPRLNLLDYQISPAELPSQVLWKAEAMAISVVKGLKSAGIFAIELFVDPSGEVYVNETAPRVHNSGHHTIEANYCSQFDMLWRIMLNYPPGNTKAIKSSAIVNLLGEPGFSGKAIYEGIEDVMKSDDVFIHLYGKKETRPGRKMGHVTIINDDKASLIYRAHQIKKSLKIKTG